VATAKDGGLRDNDVSDCECNVLYNPWQGVCVNDLRNSDRSELANDARWVRLMPEM
jgi:hypothetical protein